MEAVVPPWRRLLAACRARPDRAAMLAAVLFFSARWLMGNWESLTLQRFSDTDDYMRLVQVRDLLAGQGWFDLAQHRFDPPAGVFMHWSRLVDAPIAGIILLLDPVIGRGAAERVAVALYPLALYALAVPLVVAMARRLGGPAAGAVAALMAVLNVGMIAQFQPTRIDHHSAQILAMLAALAALLLGRGRAAGAGAGLAMAYGLAVGFEFLPHFVLLAALLALGEAFGRVKRALALSFGLSLAGGTLIFFALTVGPARWAVSACDALALNGLIALSGGGLTIAAAAAACGNWRRRLLILAAGGLASAAAALLAGPQCLAGPFEGLDPRVVTRWLLRVREMRSAAALIQEGDVTVLMVWPAALALVLGVGFWLRGVHPEGRGAAFGILVAVLAVSFAIGLLQIRAMALASVIAIPILATAVVRLHAFLAARWRHGEALVTGLALLLACDAFLLFAAGALSGPEEPAAATICLTPQQADRLRGLPPGLVLAAIDHGPLILSRTAHSVLAAPYHRATGALLDTIRAFEDPAEAAQEVVARRGVDYLVTCRFEASSALPPESLHNHIAHARPMPAWLEPVMGEGHFQVWRVRR